MVAMPEASGQNGIDQQDPRAVPEANDGQIKAPREAFKAIDANGDGRLTAEEITEGLERSGLDLGGLDVKQLIDNVDGDGSGAIDYTEFLAAAMDKQTALTEEVLWTAFNVFDRDGDGKISQSEMRIVLGSDGVSKVLDKQLLSEIMGEVDQDGDGFVDFKEFVALVRRDSAALSGPGVSNLAASGGA